MRTQPLSRDEYLATIAGSPIRAGSNEEPPFNFWPYFDAISQSDFEGYDCTAHTVTYVYRNDGAKLSHVLVNSTDPSVFMVLVLDIARRAVIGHRLLNLGNEYGLDA